MPQTLTTDIATIRLSDNTSWPTRFSAELFKRIMIDLNTGLFARITKMVSALVTFILRPVNLIERRVDRRGLVE